MHSVSVNNILWPNKCVRSNPSALNSMILLYSVVYICLVLRSRLCSNFWLLLIRYICTDNPSHTTSLKNLSLQQKHTNSKSGSIYARLLCKSRNQFLILSLNIFIHTFLDLCKVWKTPAKSFLCMHSWVTRIYTILLMVETKSNSR